MLEFIVLGQIPGTSVYVSFSLVMIVASIFSLALMVYVKSQLPRRTTKKTQRSILETAL